MTISLQETRDSYKQFYPITTRWMDNDYYGHVNNVTYYSYFDTAANRYLIEAGGLDLDNSPVIGVVVNSGCTYNSPLAYPQALEAGLRVDRLGNSSVQYGLAIFAKGEYEASAFGHFVHVFVDRTSNRSVSIPVEIRKALEAIAADSK
ncbi:MAG: acyl-CoA thioesterase [Gammaproteobacteria bacterium]|nr:acyl-CoA thioesterase [Gammaproteobacteria bacterium]